MNAASFQVNPEMGIDYVELTQDIREWAKELGFQQLGISSINLEEAEQRLNEWLRQKMHGEMSYMQRHGTKRTRPQELVPGTIRVISVRMNYLHPNSACTMNETLNNSTKGYVSRYALGSDYHKLIRKRLETLARRITDRIGPFGYRAFADSAPVMEKPLAQQSGLGWIGKHSNLINRRTGSWFFLGELYTDLPLPIDAPAADHCGECSACMSVCPTEAIVAPYVVDARRCISYLTIELHGSIPIEFRSKIGNRVFGCDDCQLVCPWNRFVQSSEEPKFAARHGLDTPELVALFQWSREDFDRNTEGSAIRRIGYERWLRNIAVALGNAIGTPEVVGALQQKRNSESDLVREHVEWALQQHVS